MNEIKSGFHWDIILILAIVLGTTYLLWLIIEVILRKFKKARQLENEIEAIYQKELEESEQNIFMQ